MNSQDYTSKWLERKFWIVIATAILMVLNDAFGFNLDSETILNVIKVVLGWVLVEGGVDAAKIIKRG